MTGIDATHDPARRSWVAGANGHADFPIQNLPLGIFSPPGHPPRAGVAIGDHILDLRAAAETGLLDATMAAAVQGETLNALLALGAGPRTALRHRLSALLMQGNAERPDLLHASAECTLHLPCAIGDYTDFYVGIHHATAIGRLFRPDNPLLENYKHIPIGYHGRASSVQPSGTLVHRPSGQTRSASEAAPRFGPTARLDYELELGVWIGPGNAPGTPIPIADAARHIAGFCLLNDWSARDLQAWEYQPLGPFLAKSFATTVSPWVITPEALAPFRAPQPPRPAGDPSPLGYLMDPADQAGGALELELEVWLRTSGDTPAHRVAASHSRHMYWTVAQMVTHHASGGCNLRPGDLLGTGTISGPEPDACGSLMEMTLGGRRPVVLPGGTQRVFLEDGDAVELRAFARREGFVQIGFGGCLGRVG